MREEKTYMILHRALGQGGGSGGVLGAAACESMYVLI